jgi:hypothetical protein
VSFSWSEVGDTLTVVGELPLAEGDGFDSPIEALPVELAIDGATDLAGNQLAPFAASFFTARRLRESAAVEIQLTNGVFNDGTPIDPASGGVGDSNFANVFFKLLVTFALPELPVGAELESAVLDANQERVDGTPFQDLGELEANHVSFEALDLNAFNDAPLAELDPLSTDAVVGTKSIDVTAAVADDLANAATRAGRSQYRFEFATATDNDGTRDISFIELESLALALTIVTD